MPVPITKMHKYRLITEWLNSSLENTVVQWCPRVFQLLPNFVLINMAWIHQNAQTQLLHLQVHYPTGLNGSDNLGTTGSIISILLMQKRSFTTLFTIDHVHEIIKHKIWANSCQYHDGLLYHNYTGDFGLSGPRLVIASLWPFWQLQIETKDMDPQHVPVWHLHLTPVVGNCQLWLEWQLPLCVPFRFSAAISTTGQNPLRMFDS